MCVHSCNTLSRLLNLCRSQLSKIWMWSLTSAELLRQATFCSFAKILSLQFTYYTVVQKLDKFIICSFNFLSVTANIFPSSQAGMYSRCQCHMKFGHQNNSGACQPLRMKRPTHCSGLLVLPSAAWLFLCLLLFLSWYHKTQTEINTKWPSQIHHASPVAEKFCSTIFISHFSISYLWVYLFLSANIFCLCPWSCQHTDKISNFAGAII